MNFEQDVLASSQTLPVVVDFWAPWCGPCQYLGPNLDKLAAENAHLWKLVKVNVDDHPELSNQYQVKGIPAVKMFHNGEVIAEFTGALSRPAIEKWLAEYLPDDNKKEIERSLAAEVDLPDPAFIEKMRSLSESHPANQQVRVSLARHLVLISPVEAVQAVEDIRMGDEYYDVAAHVRQVAHFMEGQYKDEPPVAKSLILSQEAIKEGNLDEAVKQMVEANRLDKDFMEDLPRLTAIAFFGILGPHHPLTRKYRRMFDMVLY